MRALVLDDEAVQALSDPDHDKHRTVVAHLASVVTCRRKGTPVIAVAPTVVRVEAGWDRSDTRAALVNRFRVVDHNLDTAAADTAAQIVRRAGVSVTDAHIGAVVRHLSVDDVVVLTSDPDDMARVSTPKAITAIRV